jgi:hypothetical protein
MSTSSLYRKPPQRESFCYLAENATQRRSAASRLAIPRQTKQSVVRCLLELRKGIEYTQAVNKVLDPNTGRWRPIHQDQLLEIVFEHIEDQQDAREGRLRREAAYREGNLRRALGAVRRAS